MNRRTFLALALTASGFVPNLARAQASSVTAQDAWARATPPHAAVGAVYMTLTSAGGDKLTGITSPAATTAAVHEMQMDGNIMRMRPVEGGLELPAGKPVELGPGGYHVMLEGLKQPLKQGQSVPLHLTFQHAQPLDVVAEVRPIGATAPASSSMPGMNMGK